MWIIEKFGWILMMIFVFLGIGIWGSILFPNSGFNSKDFGFLDYLICMFLIIGSFIIVMVIFQGIKDMIGYSSEFGFRSKKSRYRVISTQKKIFIIGLFFLIYVFPFLLMM